MNSQSNQSLEVNEADADGSGRTHDTAPTRFVEADGIRFAYRRFGNPIGTPIVLLPLGTRSGCDLGSFWSWSGGHDHLTLGCL